LANSVKQLTAQGVSVVVRVNRDLDNCAADLRSAVFAGVSKVILPKVVGPDHVVLIDEFLSASEREAGLPERQIGLIALIETPAALLKVAEIAKASPRLSALAFGTEDFSTECGFAPTSENLVGPSQQLIFAARAAGLHAIGLPGSIGEVDDLPRFSATVQRAKSMGFDGVLCIHPKQVEVVNQTFAVTPAELEQARRVVMAFQQAIKTNQAAVQLDGKMIDPPIVARAQAMLAKDTRRKTPA